MVEIQLVHGRARAARRRRRDLLLALGATACVVVSLLVVARGLSGTTARSPEPVGAPGLADVPLSLPDAADPHEPAVPTEPAGPVTPSGSAGGSGSESPDEPGETVAPASHEVAADTGAVSSLDPQPAAHTGDVLPAVDTDPEPQEPPTDGEADPVLPGRGPVEDLVDPLVGSVVTVVPVLVPVSHAAHGLAACVDEVLTMTMSFDCSLPGSAVRTQR